MPWLLQIVFQCTLRSIYIFKFWLHVFQEIISYILDIILELGFIFMVFVPPPPPTTGPPSKVSAVWENMVKFWTEIMMESTESILTLEFLPNKLIFSVPLAVVGSYRRQKEYFQSFKAFGFIERVYSGIVYPHKWEFCQFMPYYERTKNFSEMIFKDIFSVKNENIIIAIFTISTRLLFIYFFYPF